MNSSVSGFSRMLCVALAIALMPTMALGQSSKEKYVADFERMRASVLAMVDSMPAAGLRSAPTPGVRNFAEQIEHVVVGNVHVADHDMLDLLGEVAHAGRR